MATTADITVTSSVGLHARPAALFVKTAAGFAATITVRNLTRGGEPINAKSIISLLAAGVQHNDAIRIAAEGADADAAVAALVSLIEQHFGEGETP